MSAPVASRRVDARAAQLGRLVGGGDREPAGAAGERRAGALGRAVAVAAGLHHGAQLRRAGQLRAQQRAVALDGGEAHAGERALGHGFRR